MCEDVLLNYKWNTYTELHFPKILLHWSKTIRQTTTKLQILLQTWSQAQHHVHLKTTWVNIGMPIHKHTHCFTDLSQNVAATDLTSIHQRQTCSKVPGRISIWWLKYLCKHEIMEISTDLSQNVSHQASRKWMTVSK